MKLQLPTLPQLPGFGVNLGKGLIEKSPAKTQANKSDTMQNAKKEKEHGTEFRAPLYFVPPAGGNTAHVSR
jgi:hypothetical protein